MLCLQLRYVCFTQYSCGLRGSGLFDRYQVRRRARVGLRLEPNADDERRVRGRDHDDVTRTHAASLAHVEVPTRVLHLLYTTRRVIIIAGPPSAKWQNFGKRGPIFVFFFTVKFKKNLRRKPELKLSPRLKPVATLPCEM